MAKKPKKINISKEIWKPEEIPDKALLYCYVFKENINTETGDPFEKAFRNTPYETGTDLSSDWNKYSSPEETRQRLAKQPKRKGGFKNPDDYFVVQMSV